MLAHQEAGMVIQAIAGTMIQDMDEKIPMKDEGAGHIIAVVVCQVVDQEGTMVMVQAAMSATMMKRPNGFLQIHEHIFHPNGAELAFSLMSCIQIFLTR